MVVTVFILAIHLNISVEQFASAQAGSLSTQSQICRLPFQQKLDVGLQVTQRQGQQRQLNPHATAWVSVNCLISEIVVGGGYNIVGPVGKLAITGDAKTGNGWGYEEKITRIIWWRQLPLLQCVLNMSHDSVFKMFALG